MGENFSWIPKQEDDRWRKDQKSFFKLLRYTAWLVYGQQQQTNKSLQSTEKHANDRTHAFEESSEICQSSS